MSFKIKPDVGYSPDTVLNDENNMYNKLIITKREYGVEIPIPYSHSLSEAVKAKLSEDFTVTDFFRMGSEIIPIDKQAPFGYLYIGENPHYQLIQQIVGKEKKVTEGALMRMYIESERYLPNTKSGRKYFQEILKKMRSYGYLLVEIEKEGRELIKWYKVGRAVRTKNKVIMQAKAGYDPVVVKIWKFLKDSSKMLTFDNIRNYIINRIGWLETLDELRGYLIYMKNKGYIVEDKGYYRINKPVLPFGRD